MNEVIQRILKGLDSPNWTQIHTPEQKREKFFFLTKPDEKEAFHVGDKTDIFGRYNVLTRTDNGKRVARVYEFLAADSKVK
jgi:hypothetical protein